MRATAAPRVRAASFAALTFLFTAALAAPAWSGAAWPPVDPADLALAHPKVEPDADAEAILWTVRVEDSVDGAGLLSIRDHYLRLKVFTQKGAQEWAKHDIDYPQKGVRVLDVAARTIQPDGTVLVMDRKAVSEETIVKTSSGQTKRTSFALPGVQPGSIIEYRYSEYRRDEQALFDWFPFQLEIPIQKVVYRVRPLSLDGFAMRQLTFHVAARPSDHPVNGYYETTAIMQRAFTDEPDMPPALQERGFMVLFYTSDEAGTPEKYWPRFGRRVAEWFTDASRADDAIRRQAAALTACADGDRERVRRIAEWVRSHIRVVRTVDEDSLKAYGLRAPSDARAAFKQGGGYYRDALLVFASLARAAGLDVRWVKVPSRTQLFFDRNMLADGFLDSYQVAVRLEGRWVTLDPVTAYLPWDMQPWNEEGTTALLCDPDSTAFVESSWSQPERSQRSRRADLQLAPDGTLEGTVHVTYSGHFNDQQRTSFEGLGARELDSLVTRSHADDGSAIEVSHVQLENAGARYEPLALTAHVRLPGFATVTGKRILLEPSAFYAHAHPRYTSSTRRHPIYYHFAWTELDTIAIDLPEGWKIGAVDSVEPLGAEGVADYAGSVMVSEDQRTLLFIRRFRMGLDGSIYFAAEYYPGIQKLFEGVKKRDGATVEIVRAGDRP